MTHPFWVKASHSIRVHRLLKSGVGVALMFNQWTPPPPLNHHPTDRSGLHDSTTSHTLFIQSITDRILNCWLYPFIVCWVSPLTIAVMHSCLSLLQSHHCCQHKFVFIDTKLRIISPSIWLYLGRETSQMHTFVLLDYKSPNTFCLHFILLYSRKLTKAQIRHKSIQNVQSIQPRINPNQVERPRHSKHSNKPIQNF